MKKSKRFGKMTQEEFDYYLTDFMISIDDLDLYWGQIDGELNDGIKVKHLYSEVSGLVGVVYYTRDNEGYYIIWE